jgi:uncharacterized protein (DUF2249 family)
MGEGANVMPKPVNEILIDARWLEPPEPMEKIMQTLPFLKRGQHIRLLLHREPFPLYAILDSKGYTHDAKMQPDGSYVILIRNGGPI